MREEHNNFSKYVQYNHSPAFLTGEQIKYIKDNASMLLNGEHINLSNITYVFEKMEMYMLNFRKLRLYDLASFVGQIVKRLKPHIDYETLTLIKLRKEYQEREWRERQEQFKKEQENILNFM